MFKRVRASVIAMVLASITATGCMSDHVDDGVANGTSDLAASESSSVAQAPDPIICTEERGVRFTGNIHQTSSEFIIECKNLQNENYSHDQPSWVTFQGIGFEDGSYKATFKVQANPNVFPRAGNIRVSNVVIPGGHGRNQPVFQGGSLAITDSAEFHSRLGLDSLATAFGGHMGNTHTVTTLPLPTELDGTSVVLVGGPGRVDRRLELLYTSDNQINFHIPADVPVGDGYFIGVINTNGQMNVSVKDVVISARAPALFHAGHSPVFGFAPSMYVLRIKNGIRSEEVPKLDGDGVQLPIDVSDPMESVFFVLYGTGMRGASAADSHAFFRTSPSVMQPIQFIGPAPGFVGLDQINIPISRTMAGKGLVSTVLSVNGLNTDPVTINFR